MRYPVFAQFQLVKSSKQHHTRISQIFYKGNGNYKFATVFFSRVHFRKHFREPSFITFFACLKWCSFPGKKPSHSSFPKGFFQYILILKPLQNKKGQKNLRYPRKKQSFYKEKDCSFSRVPQIFLALLILKWL